MKITISALVLAGCVGAVSFAAAPAAAQIYPYSYAWCVEDYGEGSENCGFVSFEQCRAFIAGTNWQCSQNINYRGPALTPAPRRKHHHR